MLLESSLLFSSFFLSRRTEVPQCSGQACFDGEWEERGNREKEGNESGQEGGKTGVRVDLKQHNKETGREGGVKMKSEEKKRSAAHFTSPWLSGVLVYLTQFWFDWCSVLLMGLWPSLTLLHSSHYCIYLIIPLSLAQRVCTSTQNPLKVEPKQRVDVYILKYKHRQNHVCEGRFHGINKQVLGFTSNQNTLFLGFHKVQNRTLGCG